MAVGGGRRRQRAVEVAAVCALAFVIPERVAAQDTAAVRTVNDSLSVRFVDADIRGVIQTLGRYLPKPVLVGTIQPAKVSLETTRPHPTRERILKQKIILTTHDPFEVADG